MSELQRYQRLLGTNVVGAAPNKSKAHINKERLRNVPLVWWDVKEGMDASSMQQYAVMGHDPDEDEEPPKPVLLNTNSPWSVFLCGSQGSGKSHALSCILENCLLNDEKIGKNPNRLAGIVFHYDRSQGGDVCEAASLCSDVDVRVLVSRSNYSKLKSKYEALGQKKGNKKIKVQALDLKPSHLNTERMKALMAIGRTGEMPLYMNVSDHFWIVAETYLLTENTGGCEDPPRHGDKGRWQG